MKRSLKRGKPNIPVRCFSALLSATLAATSFTFSPIADMIPGVKDLSKVYAARSNPITYEYYTVDLGNVVPSSWIFVGTYLMSLKAVNARFYQSALESKEVYDQNIAFYSSELAGGDWKNIDNADSLSTLLPSSVMVKETTLYPYLITVVIGDDGIPRDPLTGEPIDIYNNYSFYDMENIPELDGIESYFESGAIKWSDTGSKNYFYRMLYFFFENDTLEGYREEVDIEKAVIQYNELKSTPAVLETMWDTALTKVPASYPEKYKDLMLVMRNWPSVRDSITEKTDEESEKLNALFEELMADELKEEAESTLYVTAQIDATRRAEVYYNLIENDKLFDTSGSFEDEDMEEVRIIRAETLAKQALEAKDFDEVNAHIDALDKEIAELEEKSKNYHTAIDTENADYKAGKYEETKTELDKEYDELTEKFKDTKEKYEALESQIQSLFDDMSEKDAQETSAGTSEDSSDNKGQVEEATEEKKSLVQQTSDKKADLEEELALMKARKAAAEAKAGDLDELKAKLAQEEKNLKKLEKALETEAKKLDEMRKEADGYTSSRVTSLVDSSKKYDPDKKKELDEIAGGQAEEVEALTLSYFVVSKQIKDLQDSVKEIEDGLALDDDIENLEKSIDTDKKVLDLLEAAGIDSADAQILDNLEKLAADDTAYNDKLTEMRDLKASLSELAPDYFASQALIDQNRLKAEENDGKIAEHKEVIEDIEGRLNDNNNLITEKKTEKEELKSKADELNASIEKISADLKSIDGLLSTKQGMDPNTRLREALDIKIRSLESQLAEVNDNIADQDKQIGDHTTKKTQFSTDKQTKTDALNKDASKEYFDELMQLEADYKSRSDAINAQLREIDSKITSYLGNPNTISAERKKLEEEKKKYTDALTKLSTYKTALKNVESTKTKISDAEEQKMVYRREEDMWGYKMISATTETDKAAYEGKATESINKSALLDIDIESYQKTLATYESKAETALEALKKCPEYDPSYSLDKYAEVLNSKIGDINDRIEVAKKKEPGYKDLDRERDIILKNIDILEGMKADREKKLESKYLKKLETLKEEISDLGKSIKDADDAINDCKDKKEELTNSASDINTQLEKAKKRKESISDSYKQYDSSLTFGPMPTLYFLRDAVAAGNPTMGRKYKYISAYSGMEFKTDDELLSTIEQAIELCEQAYDTYMAKSLTRGETAADYTGYILSRGVARNAADKSKAIPYLQMITDLQSVEKEQINHAERELSLIHGWMLPFSMDDFNKKRNTDTQGSYQFYIKAISDRDEINNAIAFVEDRLEYAYSLKKSFTDGGKGDLIEDHILWLENLLKELKEKAGLEDDDDDSEKSEAEEIEELMEKALSENNLAEYKRLKEYLDKVVNAKDHDDTSAGDGGRLNGESDLKPTDVNPADRPTASSEICKTMCEDVSKTDGYVNETDVAKYGAAGGDKGVLTSELKNAGATDKQIEQVQAADTNAGAGGTSGSAGSSGAGGSSSGASSGAGASTGSGSGGSGTNSDQNKFKAEDIDDYVRTIMDGKDEEEKIALVALIYQQGEKNSDNDLLNYAKNLLDELLRKGSTCIYKQYKDDNTKEYVSLGAMDRCRILSGFRYVRQNNDITMSQMFGGSASYVFTVGKKTVTKNNGETDTMKTNAVQQADSYLRDDDVKIGYVEETEAKRFMECECVYIKNTDWALLITPGVATQIIELGDIINEMVSRGETVNIPKR